ncbi:hypothetical protein [Chengkuizengella axinellae]|uniref:Spore coat protein n=1 Tax=Chengkuizengella axinellae TaxID=3064388 RepID=A0ABT9J404_9BACL|nr:hypothetical protein [Chengkuizengella sp. 2205SS18-9]MDP5276356.1 hypothetical protein [Chengkuizengella sp. 2205SS18-9]
MLRLSYAVCFEGVSGGSSSNRHYNRCVNSDLINVDNFIAFTSAGNIPICQFTGVIPFNTTIPINMLKQIKRNKGECACCEDTMTNLLISLKGQRVTIVFLDAEITETITETGEGIVILDNRIAVSTCAIVSVTPISIQQQIDDSSSFFNFQQIKNSSPAT